jgi:hypothetical protein
MDSKVLLLVRKSGKSEKSGRLKSCRLSLISVQIRIEAALVFRTFPTFRTFGLNKKLPLAYKFENRIFANLILE